VNRASLGAHEVPDALAARLRDLGEACSNVYGEDRLKMAFIQGLPKHLQVDAQLQPPVHGAHPAAARVVHPRKA